jgi:hypothetical protein
MTRPHGCLPQVDFDEKSPIELLQVLNDVFAKLEPQMAVSAPPPCTRRGRMGVGVPDPVCCEQVDVRDENAEARLARMLQFLAMLKFQIDESQRASFEQGERRGLMGGPLLHRTWWW